MVSPKAETTGFCAAPGRNPHAAGKLPREREKNMRLVTKSSGLAALALTGLMNTAAFAQSLPVIGKPVADGMGLQPPSSPVAVQAHNLDNMLLIICTVIVVFVTALLAIVVVRFNAKSNPTPAKFTHNTPLEIVWTLVPILILVFIGSFSVPALFNQIEVPTPDMTVKVTGNQWYWSYEYPDEGVSFDSMKLEKDQLVANGYTEADYLLAVDNALVVPVGKVIKVQITGSDVIHAWAVPAFAVMHSAVPGRLGELWFKVDTAGVYFGQCTALCGKDHAYMPIAVKAVPEDVYLKWLEAAKAGNYQLASN
jgi:cytochrome c oxidase subunit II